MFKTDVSLQGGFHSYCLVFKVKEAKKMHALQHGIQNKRHIVITKGHNFSSTVNPTLSCITVVAIRVSGNARSGGAA